MCFEKNNPNVEVFNYTSIILQIHQLCHSSAQYGKNNLKIVEELSKKQMLEKTTLDQDNGDETLQRQTWKSFFKEVTWRMEHSRYFFFFANGAGAMNSYCTELLSPQTGIAALTLTVMKGFEAKKRMIPRCSSHIRLSCIFFHSAHLHIRQESNPGA